MHRERGAQGLITRCNFRYKVRGCNCLVPGDGSNGPNSCTGSESAVTETRNLVNTLQRLHVVFWASLVSDEEVSSRKRLLKQLQM